MSPSRDEKSQFWANFDSSGIPVPSPFTDQSEIWCASRDPSSTHSLSVKFHLNRLMVSHSSSQAEETPTFFRFWTSAFCGVANWQHVDKVERVCTTTKLPLSSGIKIFLYTNAFKAKSSVQIPSFTSVTSRSQRDGQTRLNVFSRRGSVKPSCC